MAVKIKAIQRRNINKPNEPAKWYPLAIGDGESTLDDLAQHASSISTVSKADILAVLESVFDKISIELSKGKIVRVGDYFTVQVGVSGTPSDKEQEVNGSKVKSAHILFRPGKDMSDMVKLLEFKK